MAAGEPDWREAAKALYRDAQSELLGRWSGVGGDDVEFFKEELREALLDLKQAVIDDRHADATKSADEVFMLLLELRLRSQGDSDA